MRLLSLLLLAGFSTANAQRDSTKAGLQPVFQYELLRELDSLAENGLQDAVLQNKMYEQFRCLLGAFANDSLLILAAYDPGASYVAPDGYSPKRFCPPRITIGTWHTHLPWMMTRLMPGGPLLIGERLPAETVCRISPVDRGTATWLAQNQGLVVFMIQVDKQTRCGWVYMRGEFKELNFSKIGAYY